MVTVASDNPYPSVLFVETVDPATPAAGTQRLFVDTDGILKLIDDAAVVTEISSVVGVTAHLADTSDAHDASAISFSPTGTIAATDVQAAIAEVASEATANLAGVELDYVASTSQANITATTAATADTVVSGSAVAYDGSTVVLIEFYSPDAQADAGAAGRSLVIVLYDGTTELGQLAVIIGPSTTAARHPVHLARRLTPSAATHTYHIKAFVSAGTGIIRCGAGTSGTNMPMFIRITRV